MLTVAGAGIIRVSRRRILSRTRRFWCLFKQWQQRMDARTMAQVAIAWTLAQGEVIVPIPGTKRRPYLGENIAAAELSLTAEEMAALGANFEPDVTAGDRYPEEQMKRVGI